MTKHTRQGPPHPKPFPLKATLTSKSLLESKAACLVEYRPLIVRLAVSGSAFTNDVIQGWSRRIPHSGWEGGVNDWAR